MNTWTETPPTGPGWFWTRRYSADGVVAPTTPNYLYAGQTPTHWRKLREDSLAMADQLPEHLTALNAIPDAAWKVEYAPCIPPQ